MSVVHDMSPQDILYLSTTIGEELLINGAEVSRVENTIHYLCTAFGAERVDVFTITSSIVVTMFMNQHAYTQTRRIHSTQYNMQRLTLFNQMAHRIADMCSPDYPETVSLSLAEIMQEIQQIQAVPVYAFQSKIFFYALVSSVFSVFFGGDLWDAAASAFVGILLCFLQVWLEKHEINHFFTIFLCSIFGGILAIFFVRIGLGHSAEMISIGNIMLLTPGLAMTNGIRDMFSGNMISGLLRLSEALLLATVIALAFVWASMLFA